MTPPNPLIPMCHPGFRAAEDRDPDARGLPEKSVLLGPALAGHSPSMRDDTGGPHP